MTAATRYLFGRVGPYGLLIPAMLVTRVAEESKEPVEAVGLTIDLRSLFSLSFDQPGQQVILAPIAAHNLTLVLDSIGQLHAIEDEAFCALPSLFRYAADMFDAICERSIEGKQALRLRGDARFLQMSEASKIIPSAGRTR